MAHLNQRERTELAEQLAGMKFKKAQGKVRGLDHNGRLAYFRNQQTPTRLLTRYTLPTLGVVITLVEEHSSKTNAAKIFSEFALEEVIVEPTPDNTLR